MMKKYNYFMLHLSCPIIRLRCRRVNVEIFPVYSSVNAVQPNAFVL